MVKEGKTIVASLLFLIPALLSAQTATQERKDSLVRLIKAESIQLIEKGASHYRKAVDATFLHNGTYLICDTAQWYVEERKIIAEGNVQVIQDETILTGDNLEYLIDESLVQFRGSVVQLVDKDQNTLRTRYLDYNTRDSVAYFQNGGSMRDKDGQVIESIDGSYDSKAGLFSFSNKVNMFTDSIFVKTEALDYGTAESMAVFKKPIDFWKDGNMLSANGGWYRRPVQTFFFTGHVHATSKDQEAWCDSLYYYRNTDNLHLLGNAQVQDTTRSIFALAGSIFYEDSLKQVTLTRDAAVAMDTDRNVRELRSVPDSTAEGGFRYDTVRRTEVDTMYFGADKIVYRSIRKCDISPSEIKEAEARLTEMHVDAVSEYRKKAAEAAAQAEAEKREKYAGQNEAEARKAAAAKDSEAKPAGKLRGKKGGAAEAEEVPGEAVNSDPVSGGAAHPSQSGDWAPPTHDAVGGTPLGIDSLSLARTDSTVLAAPLDSSSLAATADSSLAAASLDTASMAAPADSAAIADSLAKIAPPDTTKFGFLDAAGDVKIYRYDLQVRCDSLRYNDLDSIARFYLDPVVWNDGNRQYTADSLFVLIKGRSAERASLMSNAFIATQETETLFDQIRATEVMAYFDSTSALSRFDALGGANAVFFLKENDEFATANKVDTKMLSATFADGDLKQIYYYEAPKNDAWPVPQMAQSDRSLKGFKWRPDEQPQGKEDITPLKVRPSERLAFESRPRAEFKQTDIYFPGYMRKIYKEISDRKDRKAASAKTQQNGAPAAAVDARPEEVRKDTVSHKIGPVPASLDSNATAPVVVPLDTLAAMADSLSARNDSLAAAPAKTAAELRREAREARWAEMDMRDAAKAQAKLDKKKARQQAREKKAREKQRIQNEKDRIKLEKYIERYRRQKERREARAQRHLTSREVNPSQSGDWAPPAHDAAGGTPPGGQVPLGSTLPNSNQSVNDNGKDSGQVSEVRQSGHPEQRGELDPTLDGKATQSSEAPLQRAE